MASVRVFHEDGRVSWGSFDARWDEVRPVLWPSREEAARTDAVADGERMNRAEHFNGDIRAVHTQAGTVVVDLSRCEPVVVESVDGGIADWWTALATKDGRLLATNHRPNEVHVKEQGLFRPHPDYLPSQIPVTGGTWDGIDWSDVDPDAQPAMAGPA